MLDTNEFEVNFCGAEEEAVASGKGRRASSEGVSGSVGGDAHSKGCLRRYCSLWKSTSMSDKTGT